MQSKATQRLADHHQDAIRLLCGSALVPGRRLSAGGSAGVTRGHVALTGGRYVRGLLEMHFAKLARHTGENVQQRII